MALDRVMGFNASAPERTPDQFAFIGKQHFYPVDTVSMLVKYLNYSIKVLNTYCTVPSLSLGR